MLSGHQQQQLKEVFAAIGIQLPTKRGGSLGIRVLNDTQPMSRSVTPSRGRSMTPSSRRAGRSTTPSRRHQQQLQDVMVEFQSFFSQFGPSFRHLHSWVFKPVLPANLVAKIDAVMAYLGESLRRDSAASIGHIFLNFFSERLGLKSLVEHNILDLLASCLLHRKAIMEVDIFVRVVSGFYDSTDVLFIEYVKQFLRPLADNLVSLDDCEKLTATIFGSEQAAVGDAVLDTLHVELENAGSSSAAIDVAYYLYISVWVFHHQRLDMDVRDSLHGFEQFVRDSLQTGWTQATVALPTREPPKNLIDSYIDSIISLKNQTKLLESRQLRDSTEEVVNQILKEACVAHTGKCDAHTLSQADALVQAVMSDDKSRWLRMAAESGWVKAMKERDRVMDSASSEETEVSLRRFCDAICSAMVHSSSYH